VIRPVEIARLAGLIEGEGNISINGRSLTLRIKMGDRDVVNRAANLLPRTPDRASAPRYCGATRSDAGCPLILIRTAVSSSAVGVMRYIASSCST